MQWSFLTWNNPLYIARLNSLTDRVVTFSCMLLDIDMHALFETKVSISLFQGCLQFKTR